MPDASEVTFTISGERYRLTREQVETVIRQAMARGEIEPVTKHFVEINDTEVPIKQAFALATGLNRLDFTTAQTRPPLRKLGFRLGERTSS